MRPTRRSFLKGLGAGVAAVLSPVSLRLSAAEAPTVEPIRDSMTGQLERVYRTAIEQTGKPPRVFLLSRKNMANYVAELTGHNPLAFPPTGYQAVSFGGVDVVWHDELWKSLENADWLNELGKRLTIPVHEGRNVGVCAGGLDMELPAPNVQAYSTLAINLERAAPDVGWTQDYWQFHYPVRRLTRG